MNIFVCILIGFAIVGLLDKLQNGKWGLAGCIDQALNTMGNLCLSLLGFYCLFVTLSDQLDLSFLRLHPSSSVIIGSLLAPDLGGLPLIQSYIHDPATFFLTGVFLTSTLGCLISFQFPIFLGQLKPKEHPLFMEGVTYGLLGLIPILLLLSLQIDFVLLIPLFYIYGLLLLGLWKNKSLLLRLLQYFAKGIEIIGLLCFGIVLLSYFFHLPFVSMNTLLDGLLLVFQITMIVAGSHVLCQLILHYAKKPLQSFARFCGIETMTLIGLLLSLGSSIAILPLYPKMSPEGKRINAAFCVSGAYALGGQMGFIAAMTDTKTTFFFIVLKLTGGLLAIYLTKRKSQK